ncbi:Nn.00g066170.m01.CDS01 [Neocucurbitaria sp. VM-36]
MTTSATTLCDLPDELILETIRSLNVTRSYETQSTAFKEREKEKARQCENRVRQLALHSICLTSHRLRRIATPTLYAAFLGSATWHGFEPIRLFHRTISNPEHAIGLNVRLAECVQYVENRLSDYRGNSLHDDMSTSDATDMITQYFYLLADIIKYAPNAQHLSIVSLEDDQVSFWEFILPGHLGGGASNAPSLVASHGFPKLQTLNLQLHTQAYGILFHRICLAMTSVPLLTEIRASGVIASGATWPSSLSFQSLQRLELTECTLDFEEVLDILLACESLQHIACHWAFLDAGRTTPSDIYPGLLHHSKTLRTLCLDMREVRLQYTSVTISPLGSLRTFTNLESLTACETALLGNTRPLFGFADQDLPYNIVELLPGKLKKFALLFRSDLWYERRYLIDDVHALWHLAENCKAAVPDLSHVSVSSTLEQDAPNLTLAFNALGLEFDVIKEGRV